jgi:hypothetical protein
MTDLLFEKIRIEEASQAEHSQPIHAVSSHGTRGIGGAEMTALLLRRVSKSRPGAKGREDYDVIVDDGVVIGRIFKATTAPTEMPWMWT